MLIFGDVHGAYQTLLALIAKCPPGEPLCFVGDLIDRGPDSRSVIQFVMDGKHPCVRGNHEDLALWHYDRPEQRVHRKTVYDETVWVRNGGFSCMASYPDGVMSAEHLDFLESLPLFLEFPDLVNSDGRSLFVSHTGIAEGMNLTWAIEALKSTRDFDDSILWYRGDPEVSEGIFHAYGHTPHNEEPVCGNYANLDTGCGRRKKLTALRFPQMEIYQQEYIG